MEKKKKKDHNLYSSIYDILLVICVTIMQKYVNTLTLTVAQTCLHLPAQFYYRDTSLHKYLKKDSEKEKFKKH